MASKIGADGVEVDMGPLRDRPTFDNKLKDPQISRQFLDEAAKYNLRICSIAMSGFYAQSFAEKATVIEMVKDCIETMVALGVKVAFLPLGIRGDLVKYPHLRPAIVERLRTAGRLAEDAGVVIGLETSLDAAGEVELLEQIGSPAIKIYFNFANPIQNGRDLCTELNILGKDRICQIHCTCNDGLWLQDDKRIDMMQVTKALDHMGWSGWLVMERSRSAKNPQDVVWNYGANARYLRSIFRPE